MTCDRARAWISADLDGEADPVGRGAVHRHLDACPACREWRDRAERITRLARADAELPGLAPDEIDRLVDAVTSPSALSALSALPSWIPRRPLPPVDARRAGCHCGPDCPCVTGRPGLCACGTSCTCGVA